jgi:hypothetical protein
MAFYKHFFSSSSVKQDASQGIMYKIFLASVVGINGQVLFVFLACLVRSVRLVRFQTDTFHLFLRQQTGY